MANEIHVHTLENGVKILITKELKQELSENNLKESEFWKHVVVIKEVEKDRIVLDAKGKDAEFCPRIFNCIPRIQEVLRPGMAVRKPMVFIYLNLLIQEIKKLDKEIQKEYKDMILKMFKDLLD
jgi:hypothetical protein